MTIRNAEYWKYNPIESIQTQQLQKYSNCSELDSEVDTSDTVYGEQGEIAGSDSSIAEELISEEDAVVGAQLNTDNPFLDLDDNSIIAEYNSLDANNDGILTQDELLSWDSVIDGISGTVDNLKDVFSGLGLRVAGVSSSSASSMSSQAASGTVADQSVAGAAGTAEVSGEVADIQEEESILPDAVNIADLKDATKEDFREIAKQSEEFWAEIEDIGLNNVFALIDKDQDGKLSEEELKEIAELDCEEIEEDVTDSAELDSEEIEEDVTDSAELDSEEEKAKNTISIDDLKNAIENDKAAKEAEAEAKAKEAEAKEDSNRIENKSNAATTNRAVSGTGSTGRASGSYSGRSSSPVSSVSQPTGLDAMSIEELEAEKTSRESVLNEKREELNGVYSGDNAAVQAAEQDMEAAKEAYDKLLEEDNNIPKELKEEKQQIEDDLASNQQEIDDTKSSISDTESKITGLNSQKTSVDSSLSSLKASLSALPQKGDNAEKNAQIDQKKASIEQQIQEKESQKQEIEADIEAAEKELSELKETLSTLEEERAGLEESKQKNQEEILAAASPESKEALKEAMTKYNEAQAKVEEVKESEASRIQGEISTAEAAVAEVTQKLTEKKNVETAKENSVSGDKQAVIDWARQYDDMSQSQMSAVFSELGYQFDKGAWCADFVRMALGEAIGDENLPEWYQNISNKAYCPSIAAAAKGHEVDISEAQAGDLVLFDWDNDGSADHVGLLVDNGDGSTYINTIEGNTSGAGGSSCVEEKPRNMSTVYGIYSMSA